MKEHGDKRQSPIVQRTEAFALKETDFTPSEPITVILSQAGWIRSAKGHIDPTNMNYRSGDGYFLHATGKSNEKVYLLDNAGRSYRLDAYNLPSARGQGDPLTSLLKPPTGTNFVGLFMGKTSDKLVLASNQGYGFINELANLDTNQKSGKSVVNLDDNANLMATAINDDDTHIAIISKTGYLLIYPLNELVEIKRGKGNKLIHLTNDDTIVSIITLNENNSLLITAGKRTLTLKPADIMTYLGHRNEQGYLLPKGFQKVNHLMKLING